jgi:hypothetical protein
MALCDYPWFSSPFIAPGSGGKIRTSEKQGEKKVWHGKKQ